ncbi:disulfide bond formation protein B [Aquabacterium sp.]|uniref:disulfide bond formation protein B n=1 Tax=Aquabacterium sp. TaxID=1872578 RepID=UPI0025C5262A|nr:disulfide bond formation protein B [Aquabacterium sp.]
MPRLTPRLLLTLISLACAGSVGLALLAQHRYGMEPCPWCILQRILFVLLAVLGLVAAALPGLARRVLAGVALLGALGGMAAALWQHFVAAQSSSCALTLADRIITATGLDVRWPEAFEVRASCADAAVSVLGVPFALWSLALFALTGAILLANVLASGRRA